MSTEIQWEQLTQAQEAWKTAYIDRLVKRGMQPELALDSFWGGHPHDFDSDPKTAADTEISYLDDDAH